MADDVENRVEVFSCLLADCFHDFRVAVSDVEDADTANPVEERVSVHVLEHGPASLFYDDRIGIPAQRLRNRFVPPLKNFP